MTACVGFGSGINKRGGMRLNIVATFTKVSFEEYLRTNKNREMDEESLRKEYDAIKLPFRATSMSAGYDFYLPRDVEIPDNRPSSIVYTGIRAEIDPDYVLLLTPRSGYGFKYGLGLANTIGVIDPDYADADNEGHIAAMLTAHVPVSLKAGDRFMQGVFVPFGFAITEDGKPQQRKGGFGSTGG